MICSCAVVKLHIFPTCFQCTQLRVSADKIEQRVSDWWQHRVHHMHHPVGGDIVNFSDLLAVGSCDLRHETRNLSHLMTKSTKWCVRPAKTQISMGIRPVWSEVSLCAQWVAKDPMFLIADSKDSDQNGRMPRLICVFAGRTCHFVGFCHEAAHLVMFEV